MITRLNGDSISCTILYFVSERSEAAPVCRDRVMWYPFGLVSEDTRPLVPRLTGNNTMCARIHRPSLSSPVLEMALCGLR